MLEHGRPLEARAAAEQLVERALAAGEAAYVGADYDIAAAHFLLGRALKITGAVEASLMSLSKAQQCFHAIGASAEDIAFVAIIEAAECQTILGCYHEAAAAYEESIRRAEKIGNRRTAAVSRSNLGTVRLYQNRYDEALESYWEALRIFESLGEPRSVAISWHRIGMAHLEAGQFEKAEQSYRQSLVIYVQQQDQVGEADSLGELGNLYNKMGRLDEATTFYLQAAGIYARFRYQQCEGVVRSNLADVLIKLQRYDEARRELHCAIECKKTFGRAAESWKTWQILHNLEQATGDAHAAEAARGQAIADYLAYRRAGGESQSNQFRLFALVFQAVRRGATNEAEQTLAEWSQGDVPAWGQTLLAKLHAILHGDRDSALAADTNLGFCD